MSSQVNVNFFDYGNFVCSIPWKAKLGTKITTALCPFLFFYIYIEWEVYATAFIRPTKSLSLQKSWFTAFFMYTTGLFDKQEQKNWKIYIYWALVENSYRHVLIPPTTEQENMDIQTKETLFYLHIYFLNQWLN